MVSDMANDMVNKIRRALAASHLYRESRYGRHV